MVLTNFECWANGLSANDITEDRIQNHVDLFDPRLIPTNAHNNNNVYSINLMSSNGYYGFSNVNVAHEDLSNNNNHNFANNNNIVKQENGTTNNIETVRCKKRLCDAGVEAHDSAAIAKRCRFNDDFAAECCNDFFSLPSTQIGTQSCLMDTEDSSQMQQVQHIQQLEPQVDVAGSSIAQDHICTQSNTHPQPSQQEQPTQTQLSTQMQTQTQTQIQYQQHYQGHLHRANRDVSRCMLSHMI